MATAGLNGVFGVTKPVGMSSAQVIRDCQEHFGTSQLFKPMLDEQKGSRANESVKEKKKRRNKRDLRVKMGHGGTLDPLASGVLILGVGTGTKSLQSFLECTKTYETTILFGASTDTYDRCGKVLKKTAYDHITRPMVEEALNSFRGEHRQMPPLYSALKMEGKPLYEYAREGKPIPREIATRQVNVTELEIVDWYEPGTHPHRWPAEESTSFELGFAEQVWKVGKQQLTSKKLSPEEKEEESKAIEAHETVKRKSEERVDDLIYDRVNKGTKVAKKEPMMSGALGDPPAFKNNRKGANLVAPPPDPTAPPPWNDSGPPAVRIRMTVTSGFYVRSFCHDLGTKIGSSALMSELCRSRQGVFEQGNDRCLDFANLAEGESVWGPRVKHMLDLWNKFGNRPASPSSAAGPGHDQRSSLSPNPSRKRKASVGPAGEDQAGLSKTNLPPSSNQRASPTVLRASPGAPAQPSAEDCVAMPPSHPSRDGDEESWAGFDDPPAVASQ